MSVKKHGTNKTDDTSGCCAISANFHKESVHHFVHPNEGGKNITASFLVKGMTCLSCARKIESALLKYPGVAYAAVDLYEQKVSINFDPLKVEPDDLKAAVQTAGFSVIESKPEGAKEIPKKQLSSQAFRPHPSVIGVVVALGVVGFYLGLLTVTSDWNNARAQFAEYRWWIIALALGLGIQGTLYTYLKKQLKGRTIKAAKSSLAVSGGVSTASMAACCAHYLVAFLPALGLPFLSAAAAGLTEYQMEFFLLGVFSNLIGISIMLRLMKKNGLIPAGILAKCFTIGL